MKKVLSIVLSLVMVLCMMPAMAFAGTDAAYTDIAGETCENAVTTLSGLGVVDGYPDGSYKPEVAVKRAEAAKLIIAALGLTEEATGTKASFTDLAGYEWAEGYIGYAEALGILKGDGNGLYRPADVVSYNEMAAIVIRALGYTDDALQGTFPAAHVAKAKALGAFKDVVSGGSAGADRGDCAIMIFNVLGQDIGTTDKDGDWSANYSMNGETIVYDTMIARLGKATVTTDTIVDLEDARNSAIDLTPYIGVKADLYKNADGKVIAITDIESTLLTGKMVDGKFVAGGVAYSISTTTGLNKMVNGMENGTASLGTTEATIAAKVSGKTIKEVHSVITWSGVDKQWAKADAKAVAAATPKLANIALETNDNNEIDYTKFELVGADSLAAIPEKAIVTYYTATVDGTTVFVKVAVSTATVEGKVTAVAGATGDVTINGVVYPVCGAEGCDSVALGNNGTFYLNAEGEICQYVEATSAINYGIVLLEPGYDATAYGAEDIMKVKLLTADGAKTIYTVNEDYAPTIDAAIEEANTPAEEELEPVAEGEVVTVYEGELVTYSVNAKNEITALDVIEATPTTGKYVNGYINGQKVADNVIVFKGTGVEDYAVGSLTAIPVNEGLNNTVSYYKDAAGTGLVQVIINNAVSSDTVYGYITAVDETYDADDTAVYKITLADGTTYLTKAKDLGNDSLAVETSANSLRKLTISNGVVTKIAAHGLTGANIQRATVNAVDESALDISKGETEYGYVQINAKAAVYQYKNNKVTAITYADIVEDDVVSLFDTNKADSDGYDIVLVYA